MKRVVLLDDLKESEIRSESMYNDYKKLLSEDIKNFFSDLSKLVKIDCPGCASKESVFLLNQYGFTYRECRKCRTIFVSPRPTNDAIRSFYKNSSAGIYLRNRYIGDTLEFRSKKIFSYRTQWIAGLTEEYLPDAKIFLDYATRYPTFLKELNELGVFNPIISVMPECYDQENLLPEDTKIIRNNDIKNDSVDVFAAFEIIERIFSPAEVFKDAHKACRKGGLCVIISTTSTGFEYQVLGKYAPNLLIPDRLNLLSLESMTGHLERIGFEIVEVSTPGRLDVEMVKNTFEKNPDIQIGRFWEYLFSNRDQNALHSLQEYLQQFRLSSHVRIAAIKK